jgi:hypothetical protein
VKIYRVFITIEEEDTETDTHNSISDTCLGLFENNFDDALTLANTIEDNYL